MTATGLGTGWAKQSGALSSDLWQLFTENDRGAGAGTCLFIHDYRWWWWWWWCGLWSLLILWHWLEKFLCIKIFNWRPPVLLLLFCWKYNYKSMRRENRSGGRDVRHVFSQNGPCDPHRRAYPTTWTTQWRRTPNIVGNYRKFFKKGNLKNNFKGTIIRKHHVITFRNV